MASTTAALKLELAARFDALSRAGVTVDPDTIAAVADAAIAEEVNLDDGQVAAASAIAGTDRLVSVNVSTGAGKTTMVRGANRAQAGRGTPSGRGGRGGGQRGVR